MAKYLLLTLSLLTIFFVACGNLSPTANNEQDNNNAGPTGCCKPTCKLSSASECATDWQEGVACEAFDECQKTCCFPHCQPDFVGHCRETGGTPDNRQCDEIPECKKGCCSPRCEFITLSDCNMYKGHFFPGSCEDDPACEVGCCMPLCAPFTQAQCSKEQGYDGQWYKGSCEQFPECKKICCLPNGELMNSNECKQFGGKEYDPAYCSGPSKIEIQIETKHSDTCMKSWPEADKCEVMNNLVQKYTGSFIPDSDGKNKYAYASERGAVTYYFKGYFSNSLTGISKEYRTSHGEQPCDTFPVTYKPYTLSQEDYYQYSQTISEETFMVVTKLSDNEYRITFGGADQEFTAKRIFRRRVSGTSCLGKNYDKESDSGEDEMDMISGSTISEISIDTLSGSKTIADGQGYIVEMMRGDTMPDSTTTITWNIQPGK